MQARGSGIGRSMRSFAKDASVTKKKISSSTIKKILSYAKPYTKQLIIFLCLILIDAVIGALNPLLFKTVIDQGILKKDSGLIIQIALVLVGLSLIDAICSFLQRFFSAKIGEGLIFDMRTKIFSHIQEMPIAFFTRIQTGALVTRLNNDVLGAQDAFTDMLSTVLGNMLSVLLVLLAMFFLSWQLTLISLCLLPVFLIPAHWFAQKLQLITREAYALNAQMNSTMIERFNISGALLMKLFGNPMNEDIHFAKKARRVADIGISQALYGRVFYISLLLTASLATALVYGWGGILAIHQVIDVGTLVALTAYLNRLYGPLTALSNVQVDVMTALVSFERVFEILDFPAFITEQDHPVELPQVPLRISFQAVSFTYPKANQVSLASLEQVTELTSSREHEVLHSNSFTVEPGTVTALVGPSGAGKTTITQLIPRLYDVNAGSVSIQGINVKDISFSSLRKTIGMVTQEAHLFHDTIRENLRYANPHATDQEIYHALDQAQLGTVINRLPQKLNTVVGERGYRFSGGEKQRFAIARVILKSPEIIILDEATAHLDSTSERAIQLALKTVIFERTAIVIAHRLSTIMNADQILVISKGHIIEQGTHKQLLSTHGLYEQLYKNQFLPQEQKYTQTTR